MSGTVDAQARRGDVFSGGGDMGAMMRSMDWAASRLGPVESWPQSLLTSLSIILRSKFPMFVFWGDDLVQLYNDAYVPITGEKHPASQGSPARETWAEIWDVVGPLVESVMDRGEATWSEDQLLMMDRHGFSEETYFTFSYSPVQDESGGVGGVFCACTETTSQVLSGRRWRTVRALSEATRSASSRDQVAQRVGPVFAAADADLPGVALYLADGEGARLATSVGFPPGSLPAQVVLDDDGGVWPIARATRSGEPLHLSLLDVASDELPEGRWGAPREGVVFPVPTTTGASAGVLAVALSPARRYDDDYRSFLALVVDTLAKAFADADAREEERRRAEALAELNQAKTEFFSNVSHEFRTPLTLLLGPLGRAREADEPLPPEDVALVHRNAGRLLKLVNTLLDFSRSEDVRLDPTFRATDLAGLTIELADVFRSAAEAAGLDLVVRCDPLPEPVIVDQEMWEKIVLNLLSNALKFTMEGRIVVELTVADGAVELTVADTGAGISDEDLPRLFERFYRVTGVESRSHEGSGIGLALVADLVDVHGGEVEVDTRLGEGTTFTVRVPLEGRRPTGADRRVGPRLDRDVYVDEATGWLDDADSDDLAGPDRHLGDPGTVLVVDDNADVRRYVGRLLVPHFRVITARDGREALERLETEVVDLVLTDVMMPRLDGLGLLEAIRAEPDLATIPVVFLSARAGTESAGDGLEAGADDYVVKPFTAAELVSRVRANLEMARLRTRLADERGRADLISGVSHDMQTPLAVILATLRELGAGGLDDETERQLIERAVARGHQLQSLIRQFLDQSRMGAGQRLRLNATPVDLADLATRTVRTVARPHRLTVTAPEPVVVTVDPSRVGQIVTNLVENALRYTQGDIEVAVTSSADGHADLVVTDQGPVVAVEERDRIFDRFVRGSTSAGLTGTGLGLHLSRKLAELHEGSLTLHEHEGGNRFRLRLPVAGHRS